MPGRLQRAAGVSSKVADVAPQPSGDAHVAVAPGDMSGERGPGLALMPVASRRCAAWKKFAIVDGGERRGSLTSVGYVSRPHSPKPRAGRQGAGQLFSSRSSALELEVARAARATLLRHLETRGRDRG